MDFQSLLSSTSFSFAFLYVGRYEQQDEGLSFDNIWTSPLEGDSLNFSTYCLITLLDVFIYGAVALIVLYLQQRGTIPMWNNRLHSIGNFIRKVFLMGHSLFFFSIQLTVNNIQFKFCRWPDSNRGPLVTETITLPTEPQPLAHKKNI